MELKDGRGETVDSAHAEPRGETAGAVLHFDAPGLYTVAVRFLPATGETVATESLQVSANVLPRSLAVICAHPDDEFLHPAAIRAAVW